MWRDTYLEDRVMSADPVELIHMLYERASSLVSEARSSLATGDILARSQAISKTLEILLELEGSLNHQAGGDISRNLELLYQHMRTRLMTANIKQEDEPLAEVESLLETLGDAWKAIRPQATQTEVPTHLAEPGPWAADSASETYSGQGWKA